LEISTKFTQVVCINWTNTSDNFLVTAGKDKFASIWSIKTGQNVMQLDRHTDSIQSAIFGPDDTKLFTLSIDQ